MKKIIFMLALSGVALFACQQTQKPSPVNIQAETDAINNILTSIVTSFSNQDVETLVSVFTEDCLLLGSDPDELWNKKEITEMWTQMLNQEVELKMLGEPLIKVAADGHSAFAVQNYFMPAFSSKLQFRNGYHMVKKNDQWFILTVNTACVIKNNDLAKIDNVLNE